MAGAERVVAVGRNSQWGSFNNISAHIRSLAKASHCPDVIELTDQPPTAYARCANIVTNLGFVRPINSELVALLPFDAAILLMWEPWEFRQGEVDLDACRERGLPVLGTNEKHPRLRIFNYLPRLAEQLLFERNIEVERSRLLLVSSHPFAQSLEKGLIASGAEIYFFDPTQDSNWSTPATSLIPEVDALVIADHRSHSMVIGGDGLNAATLVEAGVEIIHICGVVDETSLASVGLAKHPERLVSQGVMTVTTDYLGPRPVIDLHAAGLAVGSELVKCLRAGDDETTARAKIVARGLGADFTNNK
ncbi:MAG: hypothetical protein HN675_05090 [Opitutae bacterium]|nr:hypothetical protein [Opitutae bacterium]